MRGLLPPLGTWSGEVDHRGAGLSALLRDRGGLLEKLKRVVGIAAGGVGRGGGGIRPLEGIMAPREGGRARAGARLAFEEEERVRRGWRGRLKRRDMDGTAAAVGRKRRDVDGTDGGAVATRGWAGGGLPRG